jgi:DNA-binding transcriptional regulator YhcF (GntR family)
MISKIQIHKQSPLGVREQIKHQIRLMIESQVLTPGQAMLSARDMSTLINVNRNTVTHAYKELSSEGLLEIVPGHGTFVKKGLSIKPKAALNKIFDEALQKAKASGFNRDEISEHFLSRLVSMDSDPAGKKVVVVDCNDEVINHLCSLISEALGVRTTGILIQELEQGCNKAMSFLKKSDLVVCGFNHLEELERAVPDLGPKVVAVVLNVDAKVINLFFSLPKATNVGLVCANQRSTHTLYNSSYFTGKKGLHRILAGYDDSEKLRSLIQECDVIFVTEFIFDRVSKLARPGQELVRVGFSVDQGIMDLIRAKLSL